MGTRSIIAVSRAALLLAGPAVATEPPERQPAVDAETYQPKTKHDNTPYRFNMEQNGKRMTADEFDAWMKARGVRVATGEPAPVAPKGGAPVKQVADE